MGSGGDTRVNAQGGRVGFKEDVLDLDLRWTRPGERRLQSQESSA